MIGGNTSMYLIAGQTADDVWQTAARLLLDPRQGAPQSSRAGDTLEALHIVLELQDPSQRWISSRSPAMNPAFALVEAFWIAAGRRDSGLPMYWNPALSRYCGSGESYHGAYGHRIRRHLGLDQLERVYSALRNNPDSRQCVLQIWDSAVDLPSTDGTPVDQDIPCNLLSIPKVRNGKLEWMQIIRSNDLFLGLPHNIVQFTVLQEMLSGWLGLQPGSYHQLSDSLHLYSKDIQAVRQSLQTSVGPKSTDSFAIDRRAWEEIFPNLMSRLERLSQDDLPTSYLKSLQICEDLPPAYANALAVCAADSARRRGWRDVAAECINRCDNGALVHLWSRWEARVSAKRSDSPETVSRELIA